MSLPWSQEKTLEKVFEKIPFGFIRDYVTWAGTQNDGPMIYHLGVALSNLSAVVPASAMIPGLPGGDRKLNIFTMLVGRQGADRKTTAIKLGAKLLRDAVPGRQSYEAASYEAFINGLAARPQQLWVLEDMADFLALTQSRQGGNYATALKNGLIRAYDCGEISRRTTKNLVVCKNPRLSFLCAVNPALLCKHTDPSDWESGLTSRFLVLYAHRERQMFDTPFSADHDRGRLREFLEFIAAVKPGEFGRNMGLDPSAKLAWRAFSQAVDEDAPSGPRARTIGPQSRLADMAVKVAGLIAVSRYASWTTGSDGQKEFWVNGEDMTAGIMIALMSYGGSIEIASNTYSSKDMEHRTQVLDCIGEDWTPMSSIIRGAKLLKKRVGDILDSLIAEKTIERQMVLDASGELYYRKVHDSSGENEHAATMTMLKNLSEAFTENHMAELAAASPPLIKAPS